MRDLGFSGTQRLPFAPALFFLGIAQLVPLTVGILSKDGTGAELARGKRKARTPKTAYRLFFQSMFPLWHGRER